MAEIFRAPRFKNENPETTPTAVGPGTYTRDLVQRNTRQSYDIYNFNKFYFFI